MSAAFHAADQEEEGRSSIDTPNFSFPRNQRISRGGNPSRASSHLPSHGSDEMSSSISSETAVASLYGSNFPAPPPVTSIYGANFPSPPPAWQPARIWQQSMSDLNAESIPGTPSYPHSLTPAASSINLHDVRVSSGPSPLGLRSEDSLQPLVPRSTSTYFKKEWIRQGQIAQLHDKDDYDFMPKWKRVLYHFAPFLALTTIGLYWLYFALRIRFVISAQRKEAHPFPLAWVFIGVEMSVAVPIFLHSFWSIFILKKRHRPKLRLVGNEVPTVDVFITCCSEDDDLILDTVRAACDLDYPQDRYRVVLLDDGKSDNIKDIINDMRSMHPNLYYRRRPKWPGVPHHFKAGNLNYGMEQVHKLPGGASEYLAGLDCDMIPEREWLRAIVPHLINDEKMALACPPQLFYNVPPGDPLCQSLDFFVHVSEPIKDALGVAWCTGSGYVVRRIALEGIGGFPRGSLAEDVATSTLLLGQGWKTAYVHEPLQFGTVPDSYGSHLKQRTRWAIGTVDTSFKLRFCLWGDKIKKMTFAQRMSTFIYAVSSLFNIFLCLSLFALPIVLISNKPLVAYANNQQLRWLIRACFGALISNRLSELALFLPAGYACGQRGARAQIWMSPYIALTIIRAFCLPKWLGGKAQAFKPSGSLKSNLNERDPKLRAPVHRRLRVILFNYLAWFHISYVYFVIAAVILATYRGILERTIRKRLINILTHAGWPPMMWIIVISAMWIPITYACDPPTTPDREDLLERDPKTGVAHPNLSSKKTAFEGQTALFEFEYSLTTAYTALVFVATFFF